MKTCLVSNPSLLRELREKINDIADHLENAQGIDVSLMGGQAGVFLFWCYYSEYSGSVDLEKKAIPFVSDIFLKIRQGKLRPSFAGGVAGIGWTLEHLKRNLFIDTNIDDLTSRLDDVLYPHMLKYFESGNYDFMHGALGIGLYYSNHSFNHKTKQYVNRLLDELIKLGKDFHGGMAWESYFSSDPKNRELNLGMAHGIASIISILTDFYKLKIFSEKVSVIIERAVNFLLANKRDPKIYRYCFPSLSSEKDSPIRNAGRLAWCYYDLGTSMSILKAGHLLNNKTWEKEAIDVLLNTTTIIDWQEAGVKDAGLCHGTSGIAHIYNRAFIYTGIEKFKESSIYWFEQSIKMAHFKDGLAGYKTFRIPDYGGYQNNYSLLEGISGIGLAMISAISKIEPKWDSVLLLS